MLSFEQIGPAAMMSRACAGLVAGHIVISLPGSEAAVRLAMERLVIPELGHLVQQDRAFVVRVRVRRSRVRGRVGAHDATERTERRTELERDRDVMRPFASTISLEEARRRLEAAVRPIARTERVPLEDAVGRVAAADVTSPLDVPPFARSAMDGYAVRRRRHRERDTIDAGAVAPGRSHLHRPAFVGHHRARHLRGNRDRRAAPGRRRCRRDGRGDRVRRERRSRSWRQRRQASTSAGAAPTSPPAIASSPPAICCPPAESARSRPSAAPASRCSRSRGWRSSPPATK